MAKLTLAALRSYTKGCGALYVMMAWISMMAMLYVASLVSPSAASVHGSAKFGLGKDPIWLDYVRCNGTEASIFDCLHNGWSTEDCFHGEDVGVICNTAETKYKQAPGPKREGKEADVRTQEY